MSTYFTRNPNPQLDFCSLKKRKKQTYDVIKNPNFWWETLKLGKNSREIYLLAINFEFGILFCKTSFSTLESKRGSDGPPVLEVTILVEKSS